MWIRSAQIFILLISNSLFAISVFALDIPAQMSRSDLDEVIQILGYPTHSKFLSNPYPLGGHSGFEIGYSAEFINTTDLSRLGAQTKQSSTFQYNRISIGKGLFNDVDMFLHFVPFSSSNEITEYGTQLKWMFYEAVYLPFSLSALLNYNNINIQDKYLNAILGWDLLGGINLNNFALYFGFGNVSAESTFSQSILDLSDSQIALNSSRTYRIHSSRNHSFVGVSIDFATLFLAAQIDRFDQPVYSTKIGLRF